MQPGPSTEAKRFFGRNASVLLDLLRFAAALAVALTHMPHHFVATGGLIWQRAGNAAVCVFFVLSGFVIRYVTVGRQSSGREYCIDRSSRIYSVVLPALLLTIVLEAGASRISPAVYHQLWDAYAWSNVPTQVLQNLTFTVGWWGMGSTPLSNGPFWSLSFECVYYVLYGLLHYTPRARWVFVPLLLLLTGPSIALLFPVWLFGAALHDVYVWLHARRDGLRLALGALAAYLWVLFLLRHPLLSFLRRTEVSARAEALTRAVSSISWARSLVHGETLNWLNRFSLSFFFTGSLLALAVLPMMLALDQLPAATKAVASRVRLVADSTFTLYVLHMPLFLFLVALSGGPWRTWRMGMVMLLVVIGISILLARVFDRLKDGMRVWLRRVSPAIDGVEASSPEHG